MRKFAAATLVLIASLGLAMPAAASGSASYAGPAATHHTKVATHRTAHGATVGTGGGHLTAQQVPALRREIAPARRKLRSDEAALIALIRTDAALIRQLPWPTVAQAIRSAMPSYDLTASQASRINALVTALHKGDVAGVARAAMNAAASVGPGQAVVAATQGATPGTRKGLLAMNALLQSLKAADTKIEGFITLAKTL